MKTNARFLCAVLLSAVISAVVASGPVAESAAGQAKHPESSGEAMVAQPAATAPKTEFPRIVSNPSFLSIQAAMNKTNLTTLKLTAELQWGMDGRVTQARILEKTVRGSVEEAVLKWVRRIRFQLGAPGAGRIPFELSNETLGGANRPMNPPSVTR
jgi:hypothetical protein